MMTTKTCVLVTKMDLFSLALALTTPTVNVVGAAKTTSDIHAHREGSLIFKPLALLETMFRRFLSQFSQIFSWQISIEPHQTSSNYRTKSSVEH